MRYSFCMLSEVFKYLTKRKRRKTKGRWRMVYVQTSLLHDNSSQASEWSPRGGKKCAGGCEEIGMTGGMVWLRMSFEFDDFDVADEQGEISYVALHWHVCIASLAWGCICLFAPSKLSNGKSDGLVLGSDAGCDPTVLSRSSQIIWLFRLISDLHAWWWK